MDADKLKELLDTLPGSPGVYLMKDGRGTIVYVGKAKNLAKRVRSYFTPSTSDTRFFRVHIRRLVSDVEIVLTASEKEALLLENSLIKLHSPRFNIKLRDDKDFLCLRLDLKHPWPKLEVIRRPKKDGAIYFGPYHSASAARETLKLAQRHFKIRSCTDRFMANRVRPCLQHQMHRCPGPCVLDVDREEYLRQVGYIRLFLLGRREELESELKDRMQQAADALEYERAASLRDQIRAVRETLAPQKVVTPGGGDRDVIGFNRQGDQVQVAILQVRTGRLSGRIGFHFTDQEFPDEEILSSFLIQYYTVPDRIPNEILVSRPIDSGTAAAAILSEVRGKRTMVAHPKRGEKASLATMADLNAAQLLAAQMREADSITDRLTAVQRRLHLPTLPRRIECVDISHLAGGAAVGAIAAVIDGHVDRAAGRTYRIRTDAKGDDYAAIREVLDRRFVRAKNNEQNWSAPDLLVIDGGRGQLGVALAVLADLEIKNQAVIALAKERERGKKVETDRIFLPGRKNPIHLKARFSPLYIVAAARDEAHRLANTFQRKQRRKKAIISELDAIPGVGPKTKKALLTQLHSVKGIREAPIETLIKIPGVGPNLAEKIKQALAKA
ncbi:MAG: excinuclease ABC subunit UvrC [Myxococcota bacterium]|nr:excinuclease ABC subunit UvrC [Myxococcota bacterium]